MLIECPFCGTRDSGEFSYVGAHVTRPRAEAPHPEFVTFVYVRENPAGRHQDLWYHGSGCRSWLVVTRDTRTHDILSVELANGSVRS
jgi:sarcosine oxidase subunit delta